MNLFKAFLLACLLHATTALSVIYGDDDRQELSSPDLGAFIKSEASAVAALVPRSRVRWLDWDRPGRARLLGQTIGEKFNLCQADRFGDQLAPAVCTGFLAAPDVLVTAGHCIPTESVCDHTAIVFGFAITEPGMDPAETKQDDVYFCKEIISSRIDPNSGMDYSVIRLDRKVPDRTPLPIRRYEQVSEGTKLVAVGHPHGGPAKAITGGKVRRSDPKKHFFVANIDGFTGNSGSPVMSEDGLVEGIIVRGETSYIETENCLQANLCPDDGCRGEDVLRITAIRDFIPFAEPVLSIDKITFDDTKGGNGNGFAEPGETLSLSFRVTNHGDKAATNLRLALAANDASIHFDGLPPETEDMAGGESRRFTDVSMTLPSTLSCQEPVEIGLYSWYSGGYWVSKTNLDLGRQDLLSFSIEPKTALPDYAPYGESFFVDVPEAASGRKVLFEVEIEHAEPKQLIITAVAPNRISGVLYKNGLPQTKYPRTSSPETVNGIYGLTIEPFTDIDHFRNVDKSGSWGFNVKDVVRGQTANIKKLSVIFAERRCLAHP